MLDLRILAPDLLQLLLHAAEHGDVGGAFGLRYGEGRRVATIEARDAADLADAIVNGGDVAQTREAIAGTRQRDLRVTERKRGARTAQHADGLLAAAHLRAAAGRIQVQRRQLLVHVHGRDAQRLHARGIQLDADLAIHAAAATHLRNAGNGQQALGDGVVHEPGQLLLGLFGRGHGVVGDRAAVDVHALHDRLLDAVGQIAADLGDGVAYVGDGAINGRADLEFDPGAGLAFERERGDVVDVAHTRNRSLDLLHDLCSRFPAARLPAGTR